MGCCGSKSDAVDAGDVRLEDAERLGEAAQQELEQVRAELSKATEELKAARDDSSATKDELAASKEKFEAKVTELNASLEEEKGQREAAAQAAQEATEELATAKRDSSESKNALAARETEHDAKVAELNAMLDDEKRQREAVLREADDAARMAKGIVLVQRARARATTREGAERVNELEKELEVAERALVDCEEAKRAIEYREGDEWMELQHNIAQLHGKVADLQAELTACAESANVAKGIVLVQRARARATTRAGAERINELEKELEVAERALADCEEAKRAIVNRDGDEWMELQLNIAQLNSKVADLEAELTACAESAKSPGTDEENKGSAGDSGSDSSLVALLKEAAEEARAAAEAGQERSRHVARELELQRDELKLQLEASSEISSDLKQRLEEKGEELAKARGQLEMVVASLAEKEEELAKARGQLEIEACKQEKGGKEAPPAAAAFLEALMKKLVSSTILRTQDQVRQGWIVETQRERIGIILDILSDGTEAMKVELSKQLVAQFFFPKMAKMTYGDHAPKQYPEYFGGFAFVPCQVYSIALKNWMNGNAATREAHLDLANTICVWNNHVSYTTHGAGTKEQILEVTQLENEFLAAFRDALANKGADSVTMAELVFLAQRAAELSHSGYSQAAAWKQLEQWKAKRAHVVATFPIVFNVLGGNRISHQQQEEMKSYTELDLEKAYLGRTHYTRKTALQMAMKIPMALLEHEGQFKPEERTLAKAMEDVRGTVPLLTAAQKSGGQEVRKLAVSLLASITSLPDYDASPFVALVKNGTDIERHDGLTLLYEIGLWNSSPFAKAGGIPPVVEALKSGDLYINYRAAFLLNGLDPLLFAKAGAIPLLVDLLRDPYNQNRRHIDVRQQASEALYKILQINDVYKAEILGYGLRIYLGHRNSEKLTFRKP